MKLLIVFACATLAVAAVACAASTESYQSKYADIAGQEYGMLADYASPWLERGNLDAADFFKRIHEMHASIIAKAVNEHTDGAPQAYLENLADAYNRFEIWIAEKLNEMDVQKDEVKFNSEAQQIMALAWDRKIDIADDIVAESK